MAVQIYLWWIDCFVVFANPELTIVNPFGWTVGVIWDVINNTALRQGHEWCMVLAYCIPPQEHLKSYLGGDHDEVRKEPHDQDTQWPTLIRQLTRVDLKPNRTDTAGHTTGCVMEHTPSTSC